MSEQLDLAVGGMTCSSCAMRIEKKLNKLEGVSATVNYATETASITFDRHLITPEMLVATVEATGYTAELPRAADADVPDDDVEFAALTKRLWLSVVLSVPVIIVSMFPVLQFDYWQWVAFALSTPVVTVGAWPFHRAALVNARHLATTMDTLISVGVTAAYVWSVWAIFFGGAGAVDMQMDMALPASAAAGTTAHIYFEVAAGVTMLILTGRYFEHRAKRRSGAALKALLALGAKDAAVVRDGVETRVPIAQLRVGDVFVVRPGEKVATDGIVIEGVSTVDASLLTGESVPVDVTVDSVVTGATVNINGRLVVRATRVGADTALAGIARLVTAAQSGKAPVQRLADRVSAVFVPAVMLLALATLGGWLATGHTVTEAFTAAVAVLIIACPCALGLATPTALLVGTGRGAQLGILIKGPEMLESTRTVDTIVFDKTGTVTSGRMTLVECIAAEGVDRGRALARAAALEDASEHPIAQAIAKAALDEAGTLGTAADFTNVPGLGVTGTVDGVSAWVGRPALGAVELPAELAAARDANEALGRTVVFVGWGGAARAALVVADQPKPSSARAIAAVRQLGLTPMLLTGDNARTAHAIARAVGIDERHVIAEVLPADKLHVVERLQREGRIVAMVGDGVNDAAALAQSDLGIAMGTGTDAAIEASDLTLVSGDLRAVPDAIRLSRRTLAIIKGNLFWAFAYNVAAIPLAALGLLNPLVAGGAMAFSSVFVVTNSLRLRRFAIDRGPAGGDTGQ